jgi:hypothetical protein
MLTSSPHGLPALNLSSNIFFEFSLRSLLGICHFLTLLGYPFKALITDPIVTKNIQGGIRRQSEFYALAT